MKRHQGRSSFAVFGLSVIAMLALSACTAIETVPEDGERPTSSGADRSGSQAASSGTDEPRSSNTEPVAGQDQLQNPSGALPDVDEATAQPTLNNQELPAPVASPVRLEIDSINVRASVEQVGITSDGAMDVPREWENVGWYEPGIVPGESGNAVIAGHYDSPTSPAIFYELGDLTIGDRITVFNAEDEELVFEVREIELVDVENAPLEKIFGHDTDDRNLNLITCDGVWDAEAEVYDQRLIVYTTLISG